ncbi:MAG: Gldg family protein [Dehalococcoidia bacterium]|nr:Gldg family protein [Dehalococcoidia bacterium]
MRRYRVLILKDLKAYFDQPTGYVLVVLFVGILSYLFFRSALASGDASLRPMFQLPLPWAMAVLVPAATMRLLAEEERDGTIELLLTHPVREIDVVASKFIAGWVFISAALGATLGIPLLLSTAADLDLGAVVAQYLGALLLAGSLVSIGVFTSSLSRNQIVAFLFSMSSAFVLLFIGYQFVFAALPTRIGSVARDLSLLTHFQSVGQGIIDAGDLTYFLGVVTAFLSAAYFMVRRRVVSPRSRAQRRLLAGVAGLIALGVAMILGGSIVPGRLDLTEGQIHTLSPATADLVSDLDDLLTVRVFASDNLPTQDALLYQEVRDFLESYERAGRGNVQVSYQSPDSDDEIAAEAQRLGVTLAPFTDFRENELTYKEGYLGIVLFYVDRVETIPVIRDVSSLEYRIASLTNRMTQERRQIVGFLAGHGERQREQEYQVLTAALSEQFDVVDVSEAENGPIDLNLVDVLVVAAPTEELPVATRASVGEYLAAGGNAMMLIEPMTIDQLTFDATPNPNSLADLMRGFGVTVGEDVVYDREANQVLQFGSAGGPFLARYPFFANTRVQDRDVVGDLETVVVAWASTVRTQASNTDGPYDYRPLFSTTQFGGRQTGPYQLFPASEPGPQEGEFPVGVAVESKTQLGSTDDSLLRMVVVGDADWLTDPMFNLSSENFVAALNLFDWLAVEDSLVAIRTKGPAQRALLFSSDRHESVVRFGNVLGVPALIVLLGLVRYGVRRRAILRIYEVAD